MTKALTTMIASDNAITKGIVSVHKRSKTLQMDIQHILVAICTRWAQTGDSRPAVAHINQLLTKGELTALRTNSIREWIEKFMGLRINEETKAFYCPSAHNAGKHLNIKELTNARWWDFDGGEVAYKPLEDPTKLLNQLIGKMQKDRAELGDASKVDPAMLEALQAAKVGEVAH